jgi:hypothetical protein
VVRAASMKKFMEERGFLGPLHVMTAKKNLGCEELKQAILAAINWDQLPCRTTEVLFKRLQEEIIRLKDEHRVLMRFNELRETLQMRLCGEFKRFADEELRAVLTLLAWPALEGRVPRGLDSAKVIWGLARLAPPRLSVLLVFLGVLGGFCRCGSHFGRVIGDCWLVKAMYCL